MDAELRTYLDGIAAAIAGLKASVDGLAQKAEASMLKSEAAIDDVRELRAAVLRAVADGDVARHEVQRLQGRVVELERQSSSPPPPHSSKGEAA